MTIKDLRITICMGYNNLSGVKPEYQAEVRAKLEQLEREYQKRTAKKRTPRSA